MTHPSGTLGLSHLFMSAAVEKLDDSNSKMSSTFNDRLYVFSFNEAHETVMRIVRYQKNHD